MAGFGEQPGSPGDASRPTNLHRMRSECCENKQATGRHFDRIHGPRQTSRAFSCAHGMQGLPRPFSSSLLRCSKASTPSFLLTMAGGTKTFTASSLRRGSQVVRPRTANPLFVGSIPTRASNSQDCTKVWSTPKFGDWVQGFDGYPRWDDSGAPEPGGTPATREGGRCRPRRPFSADPGCGLAGFYHKLD